MNKIQVKALHKNDELSRFKGNLSDPILVREVLLKAERDKKENSEDFFADKVIRMIAKDQGDFVPRKYAPIWQILLSFLYREGCFALVSVSNLCGSSLMGVLKPFTLSSALLFIMDDAHEFVGANISHFDVRTSNEASQSIEYSDRDRKKSRRKKNLKLLQDQTWSSFCAAAFEHVRMELEEVYFSRQCSNSNKLRFLKCWMKQITRSGSGSLVLEEKSEPPQQEVEKDVDDRLIELVQEIEQPVLSASAGENSFADTSRFPDSVAAEYHSETSETFLSNLSNKIRQGLEFEAMELGALAQQLVNSAIYWLNRKCDAKTNLESPIPVPKSQDSIGSLIAELLQLLLRELKDSIAKGRNNDPSSQVPEKSSSQKTIREYSDTLEDVVNKIYKKMDLLLFSADEDELPNRFLNSEDSNQSLKEKPNEDDCGENLRVSEPISTEESLQPLENHNGTQGLAQEKHARKLIEAQERRERARRFTSFTSWVPDLNRVWAPKQPMAVKPKSDPHRKESKRKKHAEELNDTVCETPMTESKRSHSRNSYDSDEDYREKGYSSQSCPSVSKALFQDDW